MRALACASYFAFSNVYDDSQRQSFVKGMLTYHTEGTAWISVPALQMMPQRGM